MFNEIWPLISVVLGIVILLVLIIGFKLNTFISLIITSMITALMLGIPLTKIMETIEKGMGSTLGHIALIFGLGAILGKLLADGGGATRIADTLIQKFGQKHVQWAMLVAAFIVGIALFFEVGLVLLIPLVFTVAKRANVSVLKLGLPMVTALSVTHGFLPPHPGPVVIAKELKARDVSDFTSMDCCSCATYRIRFGYSSCDFNYRYCLTIITIIRCKCCISCTCDRCR